MVFGIGLILAQGVGLTSGLCVLLPEFRYRVGLGSVSGFHRAGGRVSVLAGQVGGSGGTGGRVTRLVGALLGVGRCEDCATWRIGGLTDLPALC